MRDSFYVNSFVTYEHLSNFCIKIFTLSALRRASKGSQLAQGKKHHCVSLVALQKGRLEQAQSSETQRPVGY